MQCFLNVTQNWTQSLAKNSVLVLVFMNLHLLVLRGNLLEKVNSPFPLFSQSSRPTTMWPMWSQRAPYSSALASFWVGWFGVQTRCRPSRWPQLCSSSTCCLKSSWTRATPCQTSSSSATWAPSWSTPSSGPAGTPPAWACRCGGVTREEQWVRGTFTLFHFSRLPVT